MPKLQPGDQAPDFTLPDQNGMDYTLSDYLGQWVLLYFYPKDDTPGCTLEACGVRDSFPKFENLKATVFGISTDTVASHSKFAQKFKLVFPILADVDKKVVEAYGVWAKKKFMGREYMGTLRISFLIDQQGKIKKVYEAVKPLGHAEEVLADIQQG
ncbi:MAG: thioredoxin-dependent thiol peroxidase [bacterium]|nr:thioredoxin-dependent thiol peroxidase [bacterium]